MPQAASAKAAPAAAKKAVAKPAAKKAAPKGAAAKKIDYDAVSRKAYELFLARGGEHGYHIEDWLRAEKDLQS